MQGRINIQFLNIKSAQYKAEIKELEGFVDQSLELASVVVTDCMRATYPYLCAIALGIPIVGIEWLKRSFYLKKFIVADQYILVDEKWETQYGLTLKKCIAKSKSERALRHFGFFSTPKVHEDENWSPLRLGDLIRFCGGRYKSKLLPHMIGTSPHVRGVIVISTPEEKDSWAEYKKAFPYYNVKIIRIEGLIQTIMKQEIDFVPFLLE